MFNPVAHFVIRPNYEEDETVLRETLENIGCSSPAEKHMRMVLAMDRLVAATGHILQGCDGHLTSVKYCWRGGWQDHPTLVGLSDSSGRNKVSRAFHGGDWPPPSRM